MRRLGLSAALCALAAALPLAASAASAHVVRIAKAQVALGEATISLTSRKLVVPMSYAVVCPGAKGFQIAVGLQLPDGSIKALPPVTKKAKDRVEGEATLVVGAAKSGLYLYGAYVRCWDPAPGGSGHADTTVGGGPQPWSRANTQHYAWKIVKGRLRVP